MRPPGTGGAGEEGSLSLEFAVAAPALVLLLLFLLAVGRVSGVQGTFDAGVRDAARAATQARSAHDAQQRARAVLLAAVGGASQCGGSLVVEPIAVFEPGRAVTVSARCSYGVADLGLPGMPGTLTVRGSFASPLDPNRGVR
ncbi:TadE/TadG family type IV pilus assembly protein [Kineococcus glutinatus]|uniref:Pilus assembly protein n=1 Tax=Kineococcus glutinatus TaxID=1070872 RepID=A0ABP8VH63_9ACTN